MEMEKKVKENDGSKKKKNQAMSFRLILSQEISNWSAAATVAQVDASRINDDRDMVRISFQIYIYYFNTYNNNLYTCFKQLWDKFRLYTWIADTGQLYSKYMHIGSRLIYPGSPVGCCEHHQDRHHQQKVAVHIVGFSITN